MLISIINRALTRFMAGPYRVEAIGPDRKRIRPFWFVTIGCSCWLSAVFALSARLLGDEYAESLGKFVAESARSIRRYEVRIKVFSAEMPRDPVLHSTIGTTEKWDEYHAWVHCDLEKEIVLQRSDIVNELAKETKGFSTRNIEVFSEGIHRRKRGSSDSNPRTSQSMSTLDDFRKTYPPLGLIPFGVHGVGQNTTQESIQEGILLKFRQSGMSRRLANGAVILQWKSDTRPGFRARMLFSQDNNMPIDYSTVDEIDGEELPLMHQTVSYEEHDGLYLPKSVSFERAYQRRFDGKETLHIVERIGTFEFDWIQVNPDNFVLPDVEKLLGEWPKSSHEYFKSGNASAATGRK